MEHTDAVADMNTLGTTDVVNDMNVLGTSANVTNMDTVAGISGNVTTAAGISGNITTVAGISSDVTGVAGISSAVSGVNSNSSNINAVNSNSSNINTVAGDSTAINNVSGVISDIQTANSNSSNINTVAGAITNVNNVGGNIANVNTVAGNLTSVNAFGETYRIGSSNPTSSLDVGDLFYNTSDTTLKVYDGAGWTAGVTAGSGFLPLTGGGLTGALTTNSTLDGRDVSVDGTKLDGIEDNATADQTNDEIKAAVEAASDSNTFTDADHTKLNAIEASATADQTKSDIDALNIDADTLDGQHGSYYTGYTDTAVSNLVDSSPAALNTLNELAAALGDDANFSTTVSNSIGTKLPKAGGAMTGAITTNSTFDGRDVAADGTKLDTIETSATADQTASEIRALVESASDSNVFTNADHTKLNGIETSADVTDTTNVVAALTAGNNVAIAANGTISATDT